MVKKSLSIAWGIMFALCAGLGFFSNPAGVARAAMIALAVLTFVPPGVLIFLSWKTRAMDTLRLIRNLSAASLGCTLAVLVVSFLTAMEAEWVGNALHAALTIISSPMICGQIWILSLLLWAGLMWTCILLLKKKK